MKIAISGLNNTDNPAPGIPVAKSLQDKHDLIGFSYDPNEPGNYQQIFDKIYLMPYPSLGFEELKDRLIDIQQTENLDMIIPNLDAELPLYIKYQKDIEDLGIKLCLPTNDNFELRNKNRLDSLSKELGIVYPKTYEISNIFELEKLIDKKKIEFPLMVKGNYYKAYKADNLESAKDYFYQISNEWGFPILIQEVVDAQEINLVGVGDGNGALSGAVAIKKLSTTQIGKIWTAITIDNQELIQIAQKFVKQTSWRGPFELECMVDMQNIYMIEINPRFPAWVYFATDLGINLPQMVVDIANNISVPTQTQYPLNKMYIRVVDEFMTDFSNFTKLISTKEL